MCPVCVTGLYTFPSLIRKQSFAPTGVVLRFPPSFTLPQYRNLFLSPDIPPVFAALCTFVVMGRDLFLLFITQKPPSHVFVEEAFIIWTCGRSAPSDFYVLAFVLTSSEMDVGLHGWGPPPNTDDVPRVRRSREGCCISGPLFVNCHRQHSSLVCVRSSQAPCIKAMSKGCFEVTCAHYIHLETLLTCYSHKSAKSSKVCFYVAVF